MAPTVSVGEAPPEVVRTYDGTALHVTDAQRAPASAPVLVADSWLIIAGRVCFLPHHRDRFIRSCQAAGADSGVVGSFWNAVEALLPRDCDRWFPRVELTPRGELRLRIRPAPPVGTSIALWTLDVPDPRGHPGVKGPDLPLLSALRRRAAAHGGDEVLLTDSDGTALEGAATNLLWWEGDTVCVPDDDLPVLPGVTTGALRSRARGLGVQVRAARRTAAQLADHEVWLVNALHGVRPVQSWRSPRQSAPLATRAESWHRWLLSQAAEI